jgi:hypothetical protein
MDRIKEPSTWTGLLGLLAVVAGWQFAPEQLETIAAAVATIAGAVLVVIRER